MLRRSPLLDVLLGKTKQQILSATLLQPQRSWYLLELARHLRSRPSSLQRELKQLAEAGILKRQQNGNRVYFQADVSCPIFQELARIFFKTTGVIEALRSTLAPLQNEIDVAFVYGSMATSSEGSASDIDLMVVGSAPLATIAPVLRELERRLGRPINPTVFAREEFKSQLSRESHFLRSVLRNKPLFVKGGPDELGKLVASAKNQAAPHKPTGTRRPARRR